MVEVPILSHEDTKELFKQQLIRFAVARREVCEIEDEIEDTRDEWGFIPASEQDALSLEALTEAGYEDAALRVKDARAYINAVQGQALSVGPAYAPPVPASELL